MINIDQPTSSWGSLLWNPHGYGSKFGTPKLWMVNTKLDIHICGPINGLPFWPTSMLVYQAGYIPLNPIKPPFSYGFPMVFLWFSYGFPMVLGAPAFLSSTFGLLLSFVLAFGLALALGCDAMRCSQRRLRKNETASKLSVRKKWNTGWSVYIYI